MDTPLSALIVVRLAQLGIGRRAFAVRLGYANVNKALRRLDALMQGDLIGQADIVPRLARALALPGEAVDDAVAATREATQEMLRKTFVPNAVILTERMIPTQITICAMSGGDRVLRIDLDTARPRASFHHQALSELNRRTAGGRTPILFFGAATGFVVNYAWHRAIRFDLQGCAQELLSSAVRRGEAAMRVR